MRIESWHLALVCGGILAAAIMWPVRIPLVTWEEGSADDPVVLHRESPQAASIANDTTRNIAGVLLWTTERPELSADTTLHLKITDTASQVVLREQTTTLGRVHNPKNQSLNFTFSPLRRPPATLTITVSAPDLGASTPLKLRRSATAAVPFALRLTTKQPLSLALTHTILATSVEGLDIYYYWHRGGFVADGDNPYTCALDDTCLNHKNPGHFPLFYWFSALTHKAGLNDFEPWIAFWRPIFLGFWGATALAFALYFLKQRQPLLALFAPLFWLYNRWSLYVALVGQIEFLPIFFLALSAMLLSSHFWLSLLLFSVSLAFKQVAVFLVPLYLIVAWRRRQLRPWRTLFLSAVLIGSVPLVSVVPFLLDQPRAVMAGLFFSVTRNSTSQVGAPSLKELLSLEGAVVGLLMVLLLCILYVLFYQRRLPFALAALAIFLTFISFNTVLFNQYFAWAMPFIFLALGEAYKPLPSTKPR